VQTEAFTWVSSALVGGLAAGSALGGAAVSLAGESAPFVLAVVAMGLAATSALRMPAEGHEPASRVGAGGGVPPGLGEPPPTPSAPCRGGGGGGRGGGGGVGRGRAGLSGVGRGRAG